MSASLPILRRSVVAVSAAAGAWIGLGSFLIQPAILDDPAAYAEQLAGSPTAAIGLQLLLWSQLFWAVGLAGVAHLAAGRAPILAGLGGTLSVLGAFAHAVFGGALLLQLALAPDTGAAVAAFAAAESAIFLPFLVFGLVGTALGLVLVAVALLRARVTAVWIPITLMAWVLIEFVLPNFVDWATYLSLVVGVIGFGALAVAVWRSDLDAWRTVSEAGVPAEVGAVRV